MNNPLLSSAANYPDISMCTQSFPLSAGSLGVNGVLSRALGYVRANLQTGPVGRDGQEFSGLGDVMLPIEKKKKANNQTKTATTTELWLVSAGLCPFHRQLSQHLNVFA